MISVIYHGALARVRERIVHKSQRADCFPIPYG